MSFTRMGGGRKRGCPWVRNDAAGRKDGQEDGNTDQSKGLCCCTKWDSTGKRGSHAESLYRRG